MEDRRKYSRTKVVKSATLFYDNGRSSVPCVVLDRSETGAKIRIDSFELFRCPPTFRFKYTEADKIHECHLVWTNKTTIGLRHNHYLHINY